MRNLPRGYVPLSTAIGDPLWFHDGTKERLRIFVDKRGIINGLRAEPIINYRGAGYCPCDMAGEREGECNFFREYYEWLNTVPFQDFCAKCEKVARDISNHFSLVQPKCIVLLVHEAPNNPCSERIPLRHWFAANGRDLQEFDKNKDF